MEGSGSVLVSEAAVKVNTIVGRVGLLVGDWLRVLEDDHFSIVSRGEDGVKGSWSHIEPDLGLRRVGAVLCSLVCRMGAMFLGLHGAWTSTNNCL